MNHVHRVIFSGMQILNANDWLQDHAVVVEDSQITAIISHDMIKHHLPAIHYTFPADHLLIPGLIDLHVHGAAGYDVMDDSATALQHISLALAAEGTTGFLATTMTAPPEKLAAVLQTIATHQTTVTGAAILGVHLEGPFIAKEKVGAQRADAVQLPDVTLIRDWQRLTNQIIKVITLAPELAGALEFIQSLNQTGVVLSIGHTHATYAETQAAIAAGCKQATHLFNAMRGLHQREPGAVGALLLAEQVAVELIADGIHLHPAILELVTRVKNKQLLLLVTDAIRAKCLGDGQYDLGGQSVQVVENKATLADGRLAGSTLSLPQAINNMMTFTKCTLEDAIAMASAHPARVLGLSARKGAIVVGKDADLVVMQADFSVALTMCMGKVVFRQEAI
ncbi:MAG TPA: N-acetylglucosamine-6-phosphate deacetylase [Gammaproteobacteria bacterium]|nr:N-acetylglucosamine-6-phosphate deacetylase [Gammaproteobacteria bacterium]